MTKPLIGAPGGPIQATQKPIQPANLHADGTLMFYLYDESSLNNQLPVELAYALVQGRESRERNVELTGVQTVIAASLTQPVTTVDLSTLFPNLANEATSEAFERFSQRSSKEQTDWLKENYDQVREGQLGLRDLP
jgi:hypothetical protein